MKNSEIIKKNELIAEFMGLEEMDGFMTSSSGFVIEVSVKGYEYNNTFYPLNELGYNTSWDWLIPVVHKISEKTGYELIMGSGYSYWNKFGENPLDSEFGGHEDSMMEGIYKAVVEFIKWHNENVKVVIEDN